MAVASLLKKMKVQDLGFTNHPCDKQDTQTKINYLKGISLIANEDDDISHNEIKYLNILVRSFHLSNDEVKGILKLAKNPSEEMIHNIIETFQSNDIKYNFIIDCFAIADIDGNFDDEEKELIEQYEELFNITKMESEELYNIFTFLKHKNSSKLLALFEKSNFFKKNDFDYLIDYYKLDLSKEFKDGDIKAFTFEFAMPHIRHGNLKNATKISVKPINNLQFSIFLNDLYAKEKIIFSKNKDILSADSKKLILSHRNKTIHFKDSFFKPKKFTKKEKVVFVTFTGALMFIDWVNETFGKTYKLTELQADKYNNLSMDDLNDYLLDNELIIRNNQYAINSNSNILKISTQSTVDSNYFSDSSSFRIIQ